MLKMFSTQLSGLFKRIQDKEESIEDSARLLAQAIVGDGTIYLFATNEMSGVISEATKSAEPLQHAKAWKDQDLADISQSDRFLLLSRTSADPEVLDFAKQLHRRHISFVSISTILSEEEEGIQNIADVHIDLTLKKALLPDEDGNRYGYPALMCALYAYYGIKFTIDEMLREYDL
ncbi:DUF2529 domain-containing protein [Niallia sp. 01092]|uniref:DUF2529 domain-containing protein n=1 Tax=unclassified Niallia TaxID=2837522 RepID=UPI003FD1F7D3